MPDFDTWLEIDLEEIQDDTTRRDYQLWIDNQSDLEWLASKIGWDDYDLLNFVSRYDNDYEDALAPFIEESSEELYIYYQNFEV